MLMFRSQLKQLMAWHDQPLRKPLLVTGPRGTGKTHLVQSLGRSVKREVIVIDLELDSGLASLFTETDHPAGIRSNIELFLGRKIKWEQTILFVDEIQAAPQLLEILPGLQEQKPEGFTVAAGSAAGHLYARFRFSSPDKYRYLVVSPLTFTEYLRAVGEELMAGRLDSLTPQDSLPEILHRKLTDHLATFLFLGGLPGVVNTYLESGDLSQARKQQKAALATLESDLDNYGGRYLKRRLREVWRSIPQQLNSENKKFRYNRLRQQGRFATYVPALEWLEQNELIRTVNRMPAPRLRLREYEDTAQFRLYPFDVGLLGAQLNLDEELVLRPEELFAQYHDALIETFVGSELSAAGFREQFYWDSPNLAEVDFLILYGNHFLPVEVKSDLSRRKKNLESYDHRYHPERLFAATPRNFERHRNFINLPLYAISSLKNLS